MIVAGRRGSEITYNICHWYCSLFLCIKVFDTIFFTMAEVNDLGKDGGSGEMGRPDRAKDSRGSEFWNFFLFLCLEWDRLPPFRVL